jgi:hypothetical protein
MHDLSLYIHAPVDTYSSFNTVYPDDETFSHSLDVQPMRQYGVLVSIVIRTEPIRGHTASLNITLVHLTSCIPPV